MDEQQHRLIPDRLHTSPKLYTARSNDGTACSSCGRPVRFISVEGRYVHIDPAPSCPLTVTLHKRLSQ